MSAAGQPLTLLERNKQLVVRWFDEVWNRSNRNAIPELLHEHSVLHDGARDMHGPADFFAFYDELQAQFSHFHITPLLLLAEDDLVCMHWAADMRHKQSGKSVRITGTSVVRIAADRFVEAWQNWDAAGVQAQLPSQ